MTLQQAVKTLITAKAYIGLSNHFHEKGDSTKAEHCASKGYDLFLSIPDKVGTKARKVLGE